MHGRPTRGGRGNPRCGDASRRTAVVRLRTASASASALRGRFSDSRISRPLGVACGASARSANAWREGQPEMWRCKPAHSCRPTQDRMCKCGARCGAVSRTLAFLAPLVWHHGFKCSRPTRGGRGNPRCGDATQSSLVDYDKLRQGMGAFGGGCRFWNVECRVYVLPGVAHVRMRMLRVRAVCADV